MVDPPERSIVSLPSTSTTDLSDMTDPESPFPAVPPPVALPPEEPIVLPDLPPSQVPERGMVVINEVFPEASQIELNNQSAQPADISRFWICHTSPALLYGRLPDNTIIGAGDFLVINWGESGTNTTERDFSPPSIGLVSL